MKRIRAFLLLLALVHWLMPQPVVAQEKYTFKIYDSPDKDWVMEGDVATAEKLYQQWLLDKKPQPKPKSTLKVVTKFRPGYCTDYVARKVTVTWMGNANRWIVNAKAQGYLVDKVPVPGAILVTNESWWGHVAYIESVAGTSVTISEWNYAGLYKLTYRTLEISDARIKGIIHP